MTTQEALRIVLQIAEQHKEPRSIVGANQERDRIETALRLVRALQNAVV